MKSSIDYRYLKAFYYTALYLNFSKAAQKLAVAQSAISRQVKLLEDSVGEQLIVRSSQKVILTDKGKILFKAIEQFEDATTNVTINESSQLIRVGILPGLLENWFIEVIKEFTKRTKHELKIHMDSPVNLKQGLYQEQFDLIFSNENIQNDLITSLKIFDEDLVLISKKAVDKKEAHHFPWIIYDENDFLFDLYDKHATKIISVNSIASMIKLAQEGVGLAIVPTHTLSSRSKLYKIPVKRSKRPQIYMSSLNYTTYPQHINELVSIIQKNKL